MRAERIANFVIGGTEKAGTTSVFMYLSQHPQVAVSSSKETNFFREPLPDDEAAARAAYARYFAAAPADAAVLVEASPAYLGEAESVVPRMQRLVPEARFLFILREPASRLQSSYNFHLSRLNIPRDMTFEAYVGHCLDYARSKDAGKANGSDAVLDDWQMKVLEFGCYVRSLQRYYDAFPRDNIKVMFFEELKTDTAAFMRELSEFLVIDTGFWDGFEFHRENVTFQPRNALLQKMALWVNTRGEAALRRRPALKRALVGLYKSVNQSREGYDDMPGLVRRQLDGFYAEPNRQLQALLDRELPPGWLT